MSKPENKPVLQNVKRVADHFVDATNVNCPLPLLKMKQALNKAVKGEVVHVIVTDPASERDFKAYIEMTDHELEMSKENNQFLYWITKH